MKIDQLFTLFSPRLKDMGTLCFAGGAVRDELMNRSPKDFDLFVLPNMPEWDFGKIKESIGARLEGLDAEKPTVKWHQSEPFLVANLKVGNASVQVLANPSQTADELVSTFDWNVCLFARTETETICKTDIESIREGEELVLQKVTFPLSTLRRGFRFSERFKMRLKYADILTLCAAVVAKKETASGPTGNQPDMPSLAANVLVDDKS